MVDAVRNGTTTANKLPYSEVVIGASAALSLPAEREGEQGRDLWVTGTQHHCSLETS